MLIILKKIHCTVVELKAPKAVFKGVFSWSYCCYVNLLCYESDNNVFTNSWVLFDTMIVASIDKDRPSPRHVPLDKEWL